MAAFLIASLTVVHACTLPAGWTAMKAENDTATRAAIAQPSVPIEVGKPFAIDVAVCAVGDLETIQVDAVMPAHRHGMNYQPKVARTATSRFRAEAMLFHMPGLWRIRVKAYQDGKPAHFSLDMTVD